MSIDLMSNIWAAEMPADQKVVLLKIADISNYDDISWFNIKQMSISCGMTPYYTVSALRELVNNKYLTSDIDDDIKDDVMCYLDERYKNVCNIESVLDIGINSEREKALYSTRHYLTKTKRLAIY